MMNWKALEQEPWKADAACADTAPELFFPHRGESHRNALAVCDSCPVGVECGEYALSRGINHGVWGGMSERERRKIRRQRKLDGAS